MSAAHDIHEAAWLWTEFDRVSQRLASPETSSREAEPELPGLASREPIQKLRAVFDLTPFEADVLLLCAGQALSGWFDIGEVRVERCSRPTFRLALEKLDAPHWSVLSRARPLRRWNLIDVAPGSLLDAPLEIDPRVLLYLLDVPTLDERLDGFFRPLSAGTDPGLEASDPSLVNRALRHWSQSSGRRGALHLTGASDTERVTLFQAICETAGLLPWEMRAKDIPENPLDRDRLALAWTRESVLGPAALLIRAAASEDPGGGGALRAWLDGINAPVVVESDTDTIAADVHTLRLALPPLTVHRRRQIWRQSLGDVAASFNGELERMAEAFPLDAEQIYLASRLLIDQTSADVKVDGKILAWQLCREQARRPLDQLAHRIESAATWDDLVLPEAQMDTLRQIGLHAREASVVNGQWGFRGRHTLGLGLSALFSGASGTGKTMAAGILARTLDRDLYQIDLSTVVSKYIGETERHLRRIFDTAERSGAILLFDEADALFGTRSEVKDSHDRYANLEVSYLLQRMETYSGVALLTTNMQRALDQAFLRRLRFIVQFPNPSEEDRRRIWQRIFPAEAPVVDLDFDRLAQLNVSGGVIRNIAFHAAFLAADEHAAIGMQHILRAARTEYGKMDQPLGAMELRGWS